MKIGQTFQTMLFKTQAKKLSENFRKLPMRLILVVPFILQIFGAVGLTAWLSLRNGQEAVNNVANQLRNEVSERINQKLNEYLEAPHLVNQINVEAVRLGYLKFQDLPSLERYLVQQVQLFPTAGAIMFGSQKYNQFLAVWKPQKNVLQIMEAGKVTGGSIRFFEITKTGERIKFIQEKADYQIEGRPWYMAAVKTGKPVWGEVFSYHAFPEMVLPASLPLIDDKGEVIGVFSTHFFLTQISDFLKSIKIGRTGQTVIIERSGVIVASSTLHQPFLVKDDKPKSLDITNSNEPLLQAAMQKLQEKFGDLKKITQREQLEFLVEGKRQFLQVLPYQDPRGLDWLIIVTVPEADFMEQINANTKTTIFLCLGALTLATIFGILTARWITHPILRLSEASRAIASGDLDKKVELEGVRVNELGVLANSFNLMASQLKSSFEELEIRVEERTAELKTAKEIADSAKENADAANRSKSQFLANMSHELRTPLNAILGFTQLMNRDSSLNQQQQENLGIINRSGEHLLSLINDVLEMSKIEAGRITLNEQNFDFYHLLDSLEEMLQLKVAAKGLQLIFEREPDVPQYLKTDQSKLRQVLINLLGNAIKFTEKGYIIVRVSQLNSSNYPGQNHSFQLLFEIEDTGFGIATEEMDSLFEAFVQTEVGRNYHQGTGLGLPISRKFVQIMGGDITVSSQLGKGTIFKFNITATLADQNELKTQHDSRRIIGLEPNSPVYRILVVDDRPENRLLLVNLLMPLGCEVRDAENGAEAVALWSSWEPHLIWMDMRMSVMDGYEATKQIKSHIQGQKTIIIALTASAFEEEKAIVLSAGCDDFVSKPYREEIIFQKLSQYLGLRYVYESEVVPTSTEQKLAPSLMENNLSLPECLAAMPSEWVTQLHQAATKLDDEIMWELVAKIPINYELLINSLTDWINNFRFDKITNLIEKFTMLSS